MSHKLSEVSLMQVKEDHADGDMARFIVEPLSPGFGLTVGNAIRRVLLSSLPGAAITSIRIDGVAHEFSTIKGVSEDVVDLILNLKQIRFKLESSEPMVVVLDVKGPKVATAADFKCPTGVKVINKDAKVAELVTGGKLLLEATVEKGRGYLPTEQRKEEKLPIGVIAIDAAFAPIKRVNFEVENTRVGKMTNFDKLILEIETDGSITPQDAFEKSADILVDHFSVLAGAATDAPVAEPVVANDEKAEDDVTLASDKPKAKKTVTKAKTTKTKPVKKG
ncbi:MAG: DNA-directed RNA polymerase subunit alpha [Candidatus Berkelbacteria bacterium]|nr:DNA-directed RNA polymerase subunit alpha [Candidatus Berkelbacteria bacterium]MCR4307621.1 DNA-directed RNA polymerase subunit alpha [Candidatus Berkelbacteria bacterium]